VSSTKFHGHHALRRLKNGTEAICIISAQSELQGTASSRRVAVSIFRTFRNRRIRNYAGRAGLAARRLARQNSSMCYRARRGRE
jgi:hypothetical protein